MEKSQTFSAAYSLYLDFFRFAAALTVVAAHAVMPMFSGAHYVFPFGEDAVTAFFVLSGLVIAYVADTKEASAQAFLSARLAKLWSVLIPALFIGPLLVGIGSVVWPTGSGALNWSVTSGEVPRSISAALFSNELWFVSMTPNLNVPLWSIGFEFWYYMLFAIFTFAPRKARWLGIGAVLLIMGPQMWLLMPSWIMGAAIYRFRDRLEFSRTVAVAIFVLAPMTVLAGHGLHAARFFRDLYQPVLGADFVYGEIFFARDFIWQNVMGALVAAHLAGAMVLFRKVIIVEWARKPIQAASGVTYSIYLLHFPAMLMIGSVLHAWEMETMKVAAMFAGSLAISAGFGYFLEPLKFPLRDLFRRILWTFTKKLTGKMATAI